MNITSEEANNLVQDLQKLIRQPSISSKKMGLEECAALIIKIMQQNGISTRLFRLNNILDADTAQPPPLILGEVKSKSNPRAKTLLFYNHYDVQPVEPLSKWIHHPFGGKVESNRIFGRGASDDKGELMTRIEAVGGLLRQTGDVPCNIKFIVEGEEEIGSPHLKRYLERFHDFFKCDAIIWEFGYVDTKNRPIINLGMKGMLYVEVIATGPSTDIHSSLAAIVPSPAWRLVKALNTIFDDRNGKITIRGWYSEAQNFTNEELSLISNQPPFDEREFKQKYNLNHFVGDISGDDLKKALAGSATCNISGISTGHTEKNSGIKTVLPSIAKATIDFRLVANMVPEIQFERLKKHFLDIGFADLSVRFIHGLSASRTSFENPFVKLVTESAEATFRQRAIINISSAGSGPMSLVVNALKAPCVAAGCSHIFSNIHSYNEFARIDLLKVGTNFIMDLIQRFEGTN
jgi:acetylornithine deacetylase/succinyl-diaminopimelate desuccinylase-like protein